MPGKSRHGRGKHPPLSKRKRGRQRFSVAVTQQQAVAETHKPVAPAKVAAPSASVPTPMPILTPVQYPYILAELRRIGILAGIILAILVVLALVLH